MNAFLLLLSIAGATAFWVNNRWASNAGARTEAYCFWLLLFTTLFSGILAAIFHQSVTGAFLWTIGGISGASYVIGMGLVMYGLKAGPAGPTVAINNMGLLWPVVISIIWLKPRVPSLALCAGIIIVCTAVVALSLMRSGKTASTDGKPSTDKPVSRLWSIAMLGLWFAAGTTMGTHTIGATRLAASPFALCFAFNLVATLIITPFFLRHTPIRIKKSEILPGLAQGFTQVITSSAIFLAIPRLGADIVFPFVVATPIVIMLIIGHFVHKEHIPPQAWACCLLGAGGLVLLAVS
jgi:drug/metabolite transporter (DMT)-like permease